MKLVFDLLTNQEVYLTRKDDRRDVYYIKFEPNHKIEYPRERNQFKSLRRKYLKLI